MPFDVVTTACFSEGEEGARNRSESCGEVIAGSDPAGAVDEASMTDVRFSVHASGSTRRG